MSRSSSPTDFSPSGLRIGVDMDNTIVSYDGLFHRLASEKGLIPADIPINKTEIRNYLRQAGKEDAWTAMQGEAYGPRISGAEVFDGVREFFRKCREQKITVFIISHKTRTPYLGPAFDLHEAAINGLSSWGIFDNEDTGLSRENIFLEISKLNKIQRIANLGCTHFIDDLPEILSDPSFPASTARILFDPASQSPNSSVYRRLKAWQDVWRLLIPSQDALP